MNTADLLKGNALLSKRGNFLYISSGHFQGMPLYNPCNWHLWNPRRAPSSTTLNNAGLPYKINTFQMSVHLKPGTFFICMQDSWIDGLPRGCVLKWWLQREWLHLIAVVREMMAVVFVLVTARLSRTDLILKSFRVEWWRIKRNTQQKQHGVPFVVGWSLNLHYCYCRVCGAIESICPLVLVSWEKIRHFF